MDAGVKQSTPKGGLPRPGVQKAFKDQSWTKTQLAPPLMPLVSERLVPSFEAMPEKEESIEMHWYGCPCPHACFDGRMEGVRTNTVWLSSRLS